MVDDIISHPLPSPEVQLRNFIGWLKQNVGDSHFQPIDIEDFDALASIVGAVDGDSVAPLLRWALSQKLIEAISGRNAVRLTPKAWSETSSLEKPKPAGIEMPSNKSETCKGHCPQCGPDRNADIVASYERRWDHDDAPVWTIDTYRILSCRGCETVYIQHEHLFSEDEDYETDPITGEVRAVIEPHVSYWPAPARRKLPDWLDDLDDILRNILDEVYGALDADHRVLAAIGCRTALERAMVLLGAEDGLGFGEKLSKIQEAGIIGEQEQNVLTTLTDAGSAAVHRGWIPSPEKLDTLMDGVEGFLYRTLILRSAVDDMKRDVPPRPRRRKPKKGKSKQ